MHDIVLIKRVCIKDTCLPHDPEAAQSLQLLFLHLDLYLHISRTAFLLLVTSIGTNIQETSKTSTTKKRALNRRRVLNGTLKERARRYERESARNGKNRARV